MHMGTASDVVGPVTGPKIAGLPAFAPTLLASTRQPPLPQPPLAQTLQELDLKESDNLKEYDKFTDVLQVLTGFEVKENLGWSKNVKGNLNLLLPNIGIHL